MNTFSSVLAILLFVVTGSHRDTKHKCLLFDIIKKVLLIKRYPLSLSINFLNHNSSFRIIIWIIILFS